MDTWCPYWENEDRLNLSLFPIAQLKHSIDKNVFAQYNFSTYAAVA